MRYTFYHAADLHLGAASEGVMKGAPAVVREAVESSTYRAFENLIASVERDKPAFVLFAGDLYNSSDENLRARLAFRDGIVRLDRLGIPTYVIRGNHDPLTGVDPLELPESCTLFGTKGEGSKVATYRGEPVASIYGESYPSARVVKNLAQKYPTVFHGEDGLLQVAMLHGNLIGEKSLGLGEKNPTDYAPFSLDDLLHKNYDYWALGHVHSHRVLLSGISWAVYTGSIQGVSPREKGPKGFVKVEVSDCEVVSAEFCSADVLRWDECEIDVSGTTTLNQVDAKIDATVRQTLALAEGRPVVARLILKGTTELDAELRKDDYPEAIESLRRIYSVESPFFWIESFRIETQPQLNWQAIRASHSVQSYILGLAEGAEPDFIAHLPKKLREAMARTKIDLPAEDEILTLLRAASERAVIRLNTGAEQ